MGPYFRVNWAYGFCLKAHQRLVNKVTGHLIRHEARVLFPNESVLDKCRGLTPLLVPG